MKFSCIDFGWEQIESQEMVAVEIHQSNNNLALYNKQTINVECSTSQYYFSEGNYWAIRWKNKTLTPITGIILYLLFIFFNTYSSQ
jgi:hypothetical protein